MPLERVHIEEVLGMKLEATAQAFRFQLYHDFLIDSSLVEFLAGDMFIYSIYSTQIGSLCL